MPMPRPWRKTAPAGEAELAAFSDAADAAESAYATTPGSHAGRLAAVTGQHLLELAARGLLAVTPPGLDAPTIEDDARWLAEQSGHPRFSGDDGWRQLAGPGADGLIAMAYRHATDRRGGADARHAFARAAQVRDRLLQHTTGKGCTVGENQ